MPRANVATGHYEREQAGDGLRICVNYYPEVNGADPSRPVKLVTTPGSVDRDTGNVIQGNVRGLAQADAFADGKVLILDGSTVRTWVPSTGTFGTISGTIGGSDRADVAFTQTECAIAANGTLYTSDGSSFAVVADGDLPSSITSATIIGQRIVVTAGDDQWHFSDVLNADSWNGLSFYTAEAAPDDLVAARVLGESLLLFGGKTIESWFLTGDANDPFSRQPNVVAKGCLCRDGIQIINNGCIFVAEDYSVRSLAGMEAAMISPPWVVRALKDEDPADIISSAYEIEGHSFYQINTPNISLWFDVSWAAQGGNPFDAWTLRKSGTADTYDFCTILSVQGKQYAGKRTGSTLVELSRAYATDEQADASTLGTDIVREFSFHIPVETGRPALGSIFLEGSKGIGLASGDGSDPVAQMRLSFDNGNTWTSFRSRKMGAAGDYSQRTKFNRCGRGKPPQVIGHFKVVEPVKHEVTGVRWGDLS